MAKRKVSERGELLWRILVCIVSGIILGIWKWLVAVLFVIQFIIVLFVNKRNKDVADFCDVWNSELYRFLRYINFATNERPFPFTGLRRVEKFKE